MKRVMVFVLALSLCVSMTYAQIGISARAGSLGPGLELGIPLMDKLALRAGGYIMPLEFDTDVHSDEADIDLAVNAQVQVGAVSALADFHPFGGSFRLSAGAFFNLFDISSDITPTSSYFMDEKEFTADKVGNLNIGYAYSSKVNPYLGIGFGNLTGGGHLSLMLDIGVLYMGSPEVTMEGEGMIAPTANWAPRINQALETWKWYPHIALGIGFHL